jgi:excinuclease UvrABC nuclease subunit
MTTVLLEDPYGLHHSFTLLGISQQLPPFSGLYVVTRFDALRMRHTVLYIGKCQDFRERHRNHHKRMDFLLHGATHISYHVMHSEAGRTELEEQLIHRYQPPLNNTPSLVGLT